MKINKGKLLVLAAALVVITSCSKNESTKDNLTQLTTTKATRALAKPKVKLHAEYGTRKTARFNANHDAAWGTNWDNGEPCQGRSFCVFVEVTAGMASGNVIAGGVMPFANQPLTDNSSHLNLTQDENDAFYIEISEGEILPEVAQRIFAGDIYFQDYDYQMPNFVSQQFGGQTIILSAGNHPVVFANGYYRFYI
jgi:hypothetical protein